MIELDTGFIIRKLEWLSCDGTTAKPDDLIGCQCFRIIDELDSPCPECPVIQSWDDLKPVERFINDDTGKIWSVVSFPLRQNGETTGAILFTRDVTLEKRTELFEKDTEIYKKLFNFPDVGKVVIDPVNRRIIAFNDESARITGFPREHILQVDLGQVINDYLPEDFEELANEIYTKGSASREITIIAGEKKGQKVLAQMYLTEHDSNPLIFCILTDITETKRISDALIESETHYRSLVENSPDIIIEIDVSGNIIYSNRTLPGVIPVSGNVTNFLDYFPKDKHGLVRRALQKSLVRKKNTHFEIEIESGDESRWWSIRVLPLIENNLVRSFILVATDITFNKIAEDTLKKSEEKYRFLTEHMQDAVFMMDMNWNHLYISPAIQKIRGFTPDEIMVLPIEDSLPTRSLENAMKLRDYELHRLASDPDSVPKVYCFEQEENCKDGSTVWTEVRAWLVLDENRNPSYIMGITRDISERREAQEKLRQSEENYRLILDNLPMPVYIHSDNIIQFVNKQVLERMSLTSDEEMTGRNIYEFVHPDYHEIIKNNLLNMEDWPQNRIGNYNYQVIRSDGSIMDITTMTIRTFFEGKKANVSIVIDAKVLD